MFSIFWHWKGGGTTWRGNLTIVTDHSALLLLGFKTQTQCTPHSLSLGAAGVCPHCRKKEEKYKKIQHCLG